MSVDVHKIEPGTIVVVNGDEWDLETLTAFHTSLVDAVPHDRWVLVSTMGTEPGLTILEPSSPRVAELVDRLTAAATVNGRAVSEPDA